MSSQPLPYTGTPLSFEIGRKQETLVARITPTQATWILENCNATNPRKLKSGVAERYGRDMKSGQWLFTHEGIGFDKEGHLIDGQHRLWACVDAGVAFVTQVTTGLDVETREVIDSGLRRSEADVMQMRSATHIHNVNLYTAIGRVMSDCIAGSQHRRIRRQDLFTFCDLHHDALSFAVANVKGPVPFITTAPMLAVCARAWYHVNREQVAHFLRILQSGMPDGDEHYQPVLLLRNWMLSPRAQTPYWQQVTERFQKTQTALDAFLRGKRLTKLLATTDELFPLPEEQKR